MEGTRYSAYRDSGLPWAPTIPADWHVLRNGRLFAHRVQTGFPELPILEVSLRTGVRVRDMANLKRKQVMSQKEKYKRAAKDDLAYNMMRMWQGAVGPAPVDGLVSPAYVVVRPFEEANSKYFSYLFRTDAYMREVNKYSRGIVSDRNRLYWQDFKRMPSLVPPRAEQDQIVSYLRVQDAHIARLIKMKRDLIALLKEQKLRIIDRAITHGLDAKVPLKVSGVEWLGKIPEHWNTIKIKFVTKRIVGGATPKSDQPNFWNGDVVWVTPKDVSKNELLNSSLRNITRDGLKSCSASLVPPGSIVITSRAPVGNVSIARVELCTNQGCKALVLSPDIISTDYFFLVLLRMKERLNVLANGTTFAEISTFSLANELVPVPPLDEQAKICCWIEGECGPVNEAIQRADDEIRLIIEYRDRLIADVVTGQVDVRNWVPGPDDIVDGAELAALGDDEALDDGEALDGDD